MLVIVSCGLLSAVPSSAQTNATLSGTILDFTGGALPGVIVTVTNADTNLVRTTVTNAEGRYVLAALPPGTYNFVATITGFTPHELKNVQLAIAQTAVINASLQVGPVANDVTVRALPLVNTSSSELSYLVGSETIEQLPLNGRNYTDLALLQPGVLAYPHRDGGSVVAHGLGMSVNGQDPRSNVYLLDGTLLNDFTNGPAGSAAGTALGMETIREFRVETNAYSAEFGRNSGGQINVLTKSGTNRYTAAPTNTTATTRSTRATTSTRSASPNFHAQPVRRIGRRARSSPIARSSSSATRRSSSGSGKRSRPSCPTTTRDWEYCRIGQRRRISPAVAPFLNEYPRANGPSLGEGLAVFSFPFDQTARSAVPAGARRLQHGAAAVLRRATRSTTPSSSCRPTIRSFRGRSSRAISSSPVSTGEVLSSRTLNTLRLGFSRTRIGQDVEANTVQPLPPFVPGRDSPARIDIGGLRRFGPQSSANLRLVQNVFSLQEDLVQVRGRASAQGRRPDRALPGQHGQPDVQPGHLRVPEPARVPAQRRPTTSSG